MTEQPPPLSVAAWVREATILRQRCSAAEAELAAAFGALSDAASSAAHCLPLPSSNGEGEGEGAEGEGGDWAALANFHNGAASASLVDPAAAVVNSYNYSLSEAHTRASQLSAQLVACRRAPQRWLGCVRDEIAAHYAYGEHELGLLGGVAVPIRPSSGGWGDAAEANGQGDAEPPSASPLCATNACVDAVLQESTLLLAVLESAMEEEAAAKLAAYERRKALLQSKEGATSGAAAAAAAAARRRAASATSVGPSHHNRTRAASASRGVPAKGVAAVTDRSPATSTGGGEEGGSSPMGLSPSPNVANAKDSRRPPTGGSSAPSSSAGRPTAARRAASARPTSSDASPSANEQPKLRKPPVPTQQRRGASAQQQKEEGSRAPLHSPHNSAVEAFDAFMRKFGAKGSSLGWEEADHAVFVRCVLKGDHANRRLFAHASGGKEGAGGVGGPPTLAQLSAEGAAAAGAAAVGATAGSGGAIPLVYGAFLRGGSTNYCRVSEEEGDGSSAGLNVSSPTPTDGVTIAAIVAQHQQSPAIGGGSSGADGGSSAVEECMRLLPHMTLADVTQHLKDYDTFASLLAAKHQAVDAFKAQREADAAMAGAVAAARQSHEAAHALLAEEAKARARAKRQAHNKALVEGWRANKRAAVEHTARRLVMAQEGPQHQEQQQQQEYGQSHGLGSYQQQPRPQGFAAASTAVSARELVAQLAVSDRFAMRSEVDSHTSGPSNSIAQAASFAPPPPLPLAPLHVGGGPADNLNDNEAPQPSDAPQSYPHADPHHFNSSCAPQHTYEPVAWAGQGGQGAALPPLGEAAFGAFADAGMTSETHPQPLPAPSAAVSAPSPAYDPNMYAPAAPTDLNSADFANPEGQQWGEAGHHPQSDGGFPQHPDPAPARLLPESYYFHQYHGMMAPAEQPNAAGPPAPHPHPPRTLHELTTAALEERIATVTNEVELRRLAEAYAEADARRRSAERIAKRQEEIKSDVEAYKAEKARRLAAEAAEAEAALRAKGLPVPPRGYRASSSFATSGGGGIGRSPAPSPSGHFDPYGLHNCRPDTRLDENAWVSATGMGITPRHQLQRPDSSSSSVRRRCASASSAATTPSAGSRRLDGCFGEAPPAGGYASLAPPPDPREAASPQMLRTWARDAAMVQRRREMSALKEAKLKARENVPAARPTALTRPVVRDAARLSGPTASARSRSAATAQQHSAAMSSAGERLGSFAAVGANRTHLGGVGWAGGLSR